MERKSLGQIRKENLTFLVHQFGSQTNTASKLDIIGFNQVTISDIIRPNGKRTFHEHEVRKIEEKLNIPKYWMDKENLIEDGWHIICELKTFDEHSMLRINKLLEFIANQKV